jgi:hypothetical protein
VSNKGKKSEFARTITDGVVDSRPDMFNYVPKRVVEKAEAEKMGWKHYYDGNTACANGHVAARYVSNPAICIDCARVGDGKHTIYPTVNHVDDLTGTVMFVDPRADARFNWTDEIKRQFLNSWINTTSIPKALTVVKAQYTHLINLLKTDASFKAEFEAAEREVELVQEWELQGDAAGGSDSIKLAMGKSKFESFGAKRGLVDRPIVNSEDARAELAQLLLSVERTIAGPARLRAICDAAQGVGQNPQSKPDGSAEDMEEPAVLASPYDGSDLV